MEAGEQYISDEPVYLENTGRKWDAKKKVLAPHLDGKCLHLGFAGQNPDGSRDNVWLHGWLDQEVDHLVGIDIRNGAVQRARGQGFEVYHQDAQDFDVPQRFDTVVCTNVIEHLPCPGNMLASCRDHLTEDGKILITTGRTFVPWNFALELKGGIDPADEHAMWFCRATLERLLETQGLDVAHYETWGYDRIGTTFVDKVWRVIERNWARIPGFEDVDRHQHFVVAKTDD